MQIQTFDTSAEVSEAAALFLAEQLADNPESVLLLPTGRTAIPMYAELANELYARQFDASGVRIFNLDEWYGIPPEHPGSYTAYFNEHLLHKVEIPAGNVNLLRGDREPVEEYCAGYEAAIAAAGGIDLAVLGIGENGHIAFNEPGASHDGRTRRVTVALPSRKNNAYLFNNRLEEVPTEALTVGIATILGARRILLMATGESKAAALRAALNGPVTTEMPASALQTHPDVTILVDREAYTGG